MYIKEKCLFLKDGIAIEELEKYGFKTLNEGCTYCFDIGDFNWVTVYSDSRRAIYRYPKTTDAGIVKCKLNGKVPLELFETQTRYVWVTIIGDYRKYSTEKTLKIEQRLKELNCKLRRKDDERRSTKHN